MQFIETPIFTKQVTTLLNDADFHHFQVTLSLNPESGDLIRGSGGLRKIRWSAQGRGKRGGIRVIYYILHEGSIFLLLAYPKNKQDNFTNEQLKVLRTLVQQELS